LYQLLLEQFSSAVIRVAGPDGEAETPRSGGQAALGADVKALMDALRIERATLGGYDWGGRAACIVAALWPDRVVALVSGNSYNIQDIALAMEPASPVEKAAFWYQYYFHSERGRRGLTKDRRAIARLLWLLWSPTWAFDQATFERTAGPSTIPTLSKSSSTRTVIAVGSRLETRHAPTSKRRSRRSGPFPFRPLRSTATWTA
jgi:pimeloyl-ACP methyl ester carboxylesterase